MNEEEKNEKNKVEEEGNEEEKADVEEQQKKEEQREENVRHVEKKNEKSDAENKQVWADVIKVAGVVGEENETDEAVEYVIFEAEDHEQKQKIISDGALKSKRCPN